MALLCFSPPPILSSPLCPSSTPTFPMVAAQLSGLRIKPIDSRLKSFNGVIVDTQSVFPKRFPKTVKASSANDGASASDAGEPPSETKDEAVTVDKLPLESKVQQRQEQQLRMKLAKKIRLRRKRLLRKRKMRKKGRWPPSKMKKLKNV
ncbi:hypothetical protein SLA2020_213900 [Shorea laevis]